MRSNWFLSLVQRGLLVASLLFIGPTVHASDWADGAVVQLDKPADLSSLYSWSSGNSLFVVLTFDAFSTSFTGTYDPNVLYTIHIDNNEDNVPDKDIWIRFGQNDQGDWGVQVLNLPGATEDVVGPVETVIEGGNGTRAWAGAADDPFFFDLQGLALTKANQSLSFDPSRDFFAGTNVTAIVLEMNFAAALNSSDNLTVWATTGRE